MLRLEGGLRLVTDDSKVRENATPPEKWGVVDPLVNIQKTMENHHF